MRKWLFMGAAGIALVGLQACAPRTQDTCGFVQNVYGERISWKGEVPVVMHLHASVPEEHVAAIQSAINSWNEAAGKTLLRLAPGRVGGEAAARDHLNVISYSSSWESNKLSEQAKTSVHWVGDQIQEADIKVNASSTDGRSLYNFYVSHPAGGYGVSLEALVLHELGHVLGLKHKDSDSSVMATYLAANTDRVNLAETDRDALGCEY